MRRIVYILMLATGSMMCVMPAKGQVWDGPRIVSTYSEAVLSIHTRIKTKDGGSKTLAGSGFIVTDKGFVLTNAHMVPDSTSQVSREITARQQTQPTPESPGTSLQVIKVETELDIALLKLPESKAPWRRVQIGDSNGVLEGQNLFVLGFPFNQNLSFVNGTLSSRNAEMGRFQTNVLLNHGNSGGPVFNDRGEVVAMVVGGFEGTAGINFLIPINYARSLLILLGNSW